MLEVKKVVYFFSEGKNILLLENFADLLIFMGKLKDFINSRKISGLR